MQTHMRPALFKQNFVLHRAQILLLITVTGSMGVMIVMSAVFWNFYIRNQNNISTAMMTGMLLAMLWIFVTACLLIVFITHRVFGPVFRLQQHLLKRAAGENPPPIVLRKDDYLKDLIDVYNKTLSGDRGS